MAASGVCLRAGAAPLLLGLPASALVGRLQPYVPQNAPAIAFGAALSAFAASADAVQSLGRAFAALCADLPPIDPLVARGAAMGEIDLSPRQLRRRFVAATGLAPKPFARIQRLRQACVLALDTPAANWAQVAAEAGFADQAHFNRDVAGTFGITPTRLIAYLATIRHDLVR